MPTNYELTSNDYNDSDESEKELKKNLIGELTNIRESDDGGEKGKTSSNYVVPVSDYLMREWVITRGNPTKFDDRKADLSRTLKYDISELDKEFYRDFANGILEKLSEVSAYEPELDDAKDALERIVNSDEAEYQEKTFSYVEDKLKEFLNSIVNKIRDPKKSDAEENKNDLIKSANFVANVILPSVRRAKAWKPTAAGGKFSFMSTGEQSRRIRERANPGSMEQAGRSGDRNGYFTINSEQENILAQAIKDGKFNSILGKPEDTFGHQLSFEPAVVQRATGDWDNSTSLFAFNLFKIQKQRQIKEKCDEIVTSSNNLSTIKGAAEKLIGTIKSGNQFDVGIRSKKRQLVKTVQSLYMTVVNFYRTIASEMYVMTIPKKLASTKDRDESIDVPFDSYKSDQEIIETEQQNAIEIISQRLGVIEKMLSTWYSNENDKVFSEFEALKEFIDNSIIGDFDSVFSNSGNFKVSDSMIKYGGDDGNYKNAAAFRALSDDDPPFKKAAEFNALFDKDPPLKKLYGEARSIAAEIVDQYRKYQIFRKRFEAARKKLIDRGDVGYTLLVLLNSIIKSTAGNRLNMNAVREGYENAPQSILIPGEKKQELQDMLNGLGVDISFESNDLLGDIDTMLDWRKGMLDRDDMLQKLDTLKAEKGRLDRAARTARFGTEEYMIRRTVVDRMNKFQEEMGKDELLFRQVLVSCEEQYSTIQNALSELRDNHSKFDDMGETKKPQIEAIRNSVSEIIDFAESFKSGKRHVERAIKTLKKLLSDLVELDDTRDARDIEHRRDDVAKEIDSYERKLTLIDQLQKAATNKEAVDAGNWKSFVVRFTDLAFDNMIRYIDTNFSRAYGKYYNMWRK